MAIVLVAAALLKAHAVWTGALAEPGFLGSLWLQLMLIEVEAALALALLFRLQPALMRPMAMLLFSAFFTTALFNAGAGASSCACFGRLAMHPLAAAALDLMVLLLLWFWRPGPHVPGMRLFRPRAVSAAVLAVFLPAMAASRELGNSTLLVASPVDLGAVAQGERVLFSMNLQNTQDHDVEVTSLQSTCPCLQPVGLPWRLAAGEQKSMSMVLNLASEPDFAGRLLIQFRGKTAEMDDAIRGQIQVVVASRS